MVSVEVDIFSGMPNPEWILPDATVPVFQAKLSGLPRSAEQLRPGNLGYRGLIIRMRDGTDQEIRVQNGLVDVAGSVFLDKQRAFERWLVTTGRTFVDEDILQIIEADLRESP